MEIQDRLLTWYRENRRDLPWRKDKDPYKIWVSEIMLQQTRVETVIPYFNRFVEQFPTLQHLAEAEEDEVYKAWEGLGYYSRIRNLHSAVKEVQSSYGGYVPYEPKKMARLKGVGPYTLGAVLSIAYDQKLPAVDGNVMRVLSRLFVLTDDIAKPKTRKKIEQLALQLIPEEAPGDFNQALMELGATICVPSSPRCLLCPLQQACQGLATGQHDELPIKTKNKAPLKQKMVFLLIRDQNKLWVEKRPDTGLLAGFWSLPTIERDKGESAIDAAIRWGELHGILLRNGRQVGELEHIFTHRHWNIEVLEMDYLGIENMYNENISLWTYEKFSNSTLANVYRKALKFI
ncbi:A/G-specific DNA-adenine glycosylase [Seinonella peptonophila]|uniref:Adenine DNA glycosylase n=1 Tax=Seinonella peptonophila TaxID=112248 RepID=A0A1M4ZIH1_9BACL|nr:A/G-specific adenine glycosylase [Seinonella peptonophila]SHF17597.1 A/G-specific DNA-adenine glycosylase [Seinonella peptonophila]